MRTQGVVMIRGASFGESVSHCRKHCRVACRQHFSHHHGRLVIQIRGVKRSLSKTTVGDMEPRRVQQAHWLWPCIPERRYQPLLLLLLYLCALLQLLLLPLHPLLLLLQPLTSSFSCAIVSKHPHAFLMNLMLLHPHIQSAHGHT